MCRITIPNESWSLIYDFLETCNEIYTNNEAEVLKFVEGVLDITRSGAQWRLLSREHGS